MKSGDYFAAMRFFDRAIVLKPCALYFNNRAHVKSLINDYSGAISDYSTAIQLEPSEALYWYNRGTVHWNYSGKNLACPDWEKSKQLGSKRAVELLELHCKHKNPEPIKLTHSKAEPKLSSPKKTKLKDNRNGKEIIILKKGIQTQGIKRTWFLIERTNSGVIQRGLLTIIDVNYKILSQESAITESLEELDEFVEWLSIIPAIDEIKERRAKNIPSPKSKNRSSKMGFGMYSRYTIGIVYAFDPEYIEWCIANLDSFYVSDLEELLQFKVQKNTSGYEVHRDYGVPDLNYMIDVFDYIEELDNTMRSLKVDYPFKPELVELNARKREGRSF